MTVARRLTAGAAAVLLALVMGIFAGPAAAQMPFGQQIELTPTMVENLIASVPDVKATADKLSAKYDMKGKSMGEGPAGMWQAWAMQRSAHGELAAVCQKYGFADFQTWATTFTSVATAHTFARKGGEIDSKMAEAIEQVRNNPNLTPQQKEMMLQQFQLSAQSLNAMRPSQNNLDVVAPYSDELDALFERG